MNVLGLISQLIIIETLRLTQVNLIITSYKPPKYDYFMAFSYMGASQLFFLMSILHSSKKANSSFPEAAMTLMILQNLCYKLTQLWDYCWNRKSAIKSKDYCWALLQKSVNNVTVDSITSLLLFGWKQSYQNLGVSNSCPSLRYCASYTVLLTCSKFFIPCKLWTIFTFTSSHFTVFMPHNLLCYNFEDDCVPHTYR